MFVEWTELDTHMLSWIPASRNKKPGTSFEETSGWMKEAGTGQEV
jgi:hypothetical protein